MRRILWVEDSRSDQVLIRSVLQDLKFRYDVTFLADAVLVPDRIRQQRFDLVVLDLRTPRQGVLRRLQEDARKGHVPPLVVFTGNEDPNEHQMCLDRGVKAVVIKPTKYDSFRDSVNDVVLHGDWATG